jgi:hypothetical protein
MYVIITKLLQNYEWKSLEEVKPIFTLFVTQKTPLRIKWKPLKDIKAKTNTNGQNRE